MSESHVTPLPSQHPGRENKRHSPESLQRAEEHKALIRQFASGDEAAFSTFYRQLSPPLFSMVFEILKDQKDSEDVLQESFVQMWKRASTYDPARSSVFTWSVMIARHKAIDRFRARSRRNQLGEAAAAENLAVPAVAVPQADELLGQSDERNRVRAALGGLGEGQREAIELAFFGGLTQSEISEKLGEPLGTVKARIRRGLFALRDVLRRPE